VGKVRAIAIAGWMGASAWALGACQEGASPPSSCLDEGTCECVSAAQCGADQVCVDGACRWVVTPLDAEGKPDLSPGPDVSDAGPGAPETNGDAGAVVPDIPIVPGAFLAPCDGDDDCDSNKCLPLLSGDRVCTKTCVESCPLPTWSCRGVNEAGGIVAFYCLPDEPRLCEPCAGDDSCPGAGNLCLDVGGTPSCGLACGADGGCPDGYHCDEAAVSVDGVAGAQCVPDSGLCECTQDSVGQQLPCEITNDVGTCLGTQVCGEGGVLGACDARTPTVETCNGVDDDCNGFADDGVPPAPCAKTNDFGSCEGQTLCLAAVGEVCNAPEPQAETCNSLDDDCDGETDEDFRNAAGGYDTLAHCGACNHACEGLFAHAATVVCDAAVDPAAPFCRVETCEDGYVKASDTQCSLPVDHLCEPCTDAAVCGGPFDACYQIDPTDTRHFCLRDCDPSSIYGADCPPGYTCQAIDTTPEGGASAGGSPTQTQCVPANGSCDCGPGTDGLTRPCSLANEHGQCFGVATCDATAGWVGCTAKTPAPEVCNGLDDNCDGVIDEGLGGGACTRDNEFGSCAGTEVCDPSDGTNAVRCAAPEASPEVCDGIDNDCDGLTDEDFAENLTDDAGQVVALKYDLTNEHCGGCGIACAPNPPAAAVTCDGSGQTVACRPTACEDGYYLSGGACVPVPGANLCLPCTSDADCLGPQDACLPYAAAGDGLMRCGRDCSEGSIYSTGAPGDPGYCTGAEGEQGCCPAGYICSSGQCARASGDCTCDADGKVRPCSVDNAFGSCAGVEVCVTTQQPGGPAPGWQACDAPTPSAEVCDGVDNDCDGLVDQADPDVDTTGLATFPACENVSSACTGSWTCADAGGGYAWVCSAPAPETERCNGEDDDCDGETDEGFVDDFGAYTLPSNCGGCGVDCEALIAHLATDAAGAVAPGAVTCEVVDGTPACVPAQCAPGYAPFPTPGPGSTPRVCLPVASTNCQPCISDDDCGTFGDRCVSVGSDTGQFCAQRCDADAPGGQCAGVAGEQGCCPTGFTCTSDPGVAGGALLCAPDSGSCACSPLTAGLERVCSVSGDGGATTCFGTESCTDQGGGVYGWSACDVSANVEVCDGQDNDCDGTTDEGFQQGGVYATDANCGQCGRNCALAFSAATQHVFGICDAAAPGGPDCVSGGCLSDTIGGGTPCATDADCAGDAAGSTCLTPTFRCGTACASDGDCGGGAVCRDGACAPGCTSDAECTASFGPATRCDAGACVTPTTWVDLDGEPGNGCECPAADLLTLDEPDTFGTYPTAGAAYVDRNCDGIDGDLATALFVAASSPNGDGSLAHPYPTIAQALAAFDPAIHTQILVAEGVYPERVVLVSGAKLYGGYSDDFAQRDVVLFPTILEGPAPDFAAANPAHGVVYAAGITEATVLAGFEIRGYDVPPTASGGTSYTVLATGSSAALVFTNNRILGGRGGAGASGSPGIAGADGQPGADGHDAVECSDTNCDNDSQAGGAGGTNPSCAAARGCEGMEADGDEATQVKDNPAPGCTYANGGQDSSYRWGGDYCKYDCNVSNQRLGPNGADGVGGGNGAAGAGAGDADGGIVGGLWVGDAGSAGTAGGNGTGGQGGSAGAGVENDNGANCTVGNRLGDLGGTGGGGGAGGCGGTAGGPGAPGGASIAVFLPSGAGGTFPTVRGNVIVRGVGGAGGSGGPGAAGGKGGKGGFGGQSGWPAWCAGAGGSGGRGGDGGAGGGGGGGAGGASYGIAIVGGDAAALTSANTFAPVSGVAPGGSGGPSPAAGAAGGDGVDGEVADVKAY